MPQLQNNETYIIRGTLDLTSGTTLYKDNYITRAKLAKELVTAEGIPFTDLRVWDNFAALLPAAAASDDMGIVNGAVWGTNAPSLQTSDADSTTVTQKFRMQIPVESEFVLAGTMTLRLRCGMETNVSDTTATVDLEVYVDDGDAGVGSDLCATAAQSINALANSNKDFTITTASLVRGNILDCVVTVAITDGATGAAVIGQITHIELLRDIQG